MTENVKVDRFWDVVSSLLPGAKVENIKFFMGSERDISQSALADEAANAWRHVQVGAIKPAEALDKDMETRSVKAFV